MTFYQLMRLRTQEKESERDSAKCLWLIVCGAYIYIYTRITTCQRANLNPSQLDPSSISTCFYTPRALLRFYTLHYAPCGVVVDKTASAAKTQHNPLWRILLGNNWGDLCACVCVCVYCVLYNSLARDYNPRLLINQTPVVKNYKYESAESIFLVLFFIN